MRPEDRRFLQHMRDHAREARELSAPIAREEFDRNRLAQHGLTRITQIIGEAAWRVSDELKELHPEIPWKRIEGFRHKVVHEYFGVDYDTVWRVVTEHLPPLIAQLEQMLPENPAD